MLRAELLVACLTSWLIPIALLTPKWTCEKLEHFINMQKFSPRAPKGLYYSKKIGSSAVNCPLGKRKKNSRGRKKKKKINFNQCSQLQLKQRRQQMIIAHLYSPCHSVIFKLVSSVYIYFLLTVLRCAYYYLLLSALVISLVTGSLHMFTLFWLVASVDLIGSCTL